MATKFTTLLKFQLKYKLGISKIKEMFSASSSAKISTALVVMLLAVIAACILIPYGIIMSFIYNTFNKTGNIEGYFNVVTIMANVVVFLTSILSVYNIMFGERDYEILAPLPIKKRHIFLLNYVILYLTSVLSACVFLVPGFVVYFLKSGFDFYVLLKLLIGMTVFPSLPLGIAFVIVSLLMVLSSNFKYKEILITIGGIVLVMACLLVSNNNEILNSLLFHINKLSYANKFLLNSYLFTKSVSSYGLLSFCYTFGSVVLSVMLFALIYLYGGVMYHKIAEKMLSVSGANNKSKNKFHQKHQSDAFCSKEIKTILRSPIYALNCLFNIILAPLAIYMLWQNKSKLDDFKMFENADHFLLGLSLCFVVMSASMVSSTSVSREGKSFWITQIVPVSMKNQLKGRVKAAVILYWISAFIYIFLLGVLLKTKFLYIIYGLVVSFAGALPFAYAGLIIDLKRPKLFWDKESEAVKQNFNGIIGMIVAIVFSMFYVIPIGLYAVGILPLTIALVLVPVIIALCIFITKYILNKMYHD